MKYRSGHVNAPSTGFVSYIRNLVDYGTVEYFVQWGSIGCYGRSEIRRYAVLSLIREIRFRKKEKRKRGRRGKLEERRILGRRMVKTETLYM